MRSPFVNVANALFAGLGICALALGYWMIVRGDALLARPDNARGTAEAEQGRGSILARDGRPLARTTMVNDAPKREYSTPSSAQLVGLHSTRLGNTALEEHFDDLLRGNSGDTLLKLRHRFLGEPLRGADIVTTIDIGIQNAAAAALDDMPGAIVALDPRSGAILAMVSRPGFDPNNIEATWDRLRNDPAAPLINRAIQSTYPPGSTFKVITASAAVDRGIVNVDTDFRCTSVAQIDALAVDCRNHAQLATLNYRQAFAWSCNRTFALTGLYLSLGAPLIPRLDDRAVAEKQWSNVDVEASANQLTAYAAAFGFDKPIPFELPVTPSHLKGDGQWYRSLLAQTGFGQGQVSATPMQMALVAAVIANDGTVPTPYVAETARLSGGAERPLRTPLSSPPPPFQTRAIKSETAQALKRFMTDSVEYAYATQAKIPGVTVAGKTGTAETGVGETPDSWFIGFAPVEAPTIAVAVIAEHRGSGSDVATPIAQKVMAAALGRR